MTDFQGPRCETCRYAHPTDDGKQLYCRRVPPKVVAFWTGRMVKGPMGKRTEREMTIKSTFPLMLPSGWCGEHEEVGEPA